MEFYEEAEGLHVCDTWFFKVLIHTRFLVNIIRPVSSAIKQVNADGLKVMPAESG